MRKSKVKTTAQLTKEWYAKLKAEGFNDIERTDGSLTIWASTHVLPYHTMTTFTAKQDYYQLAGQFLYDHKFVDHFEKRVWEMHASGHSVRTIIKALKKERFRAYRDLVHGAVVKLRKIMLAKCR